MSAQYYPPASFYFSVKVLSSPTSAPPQTSLDAAFQEVSGIRAEFDVEEVVEGGENRFAYRLPRRSKYPNLVLKRGIAVKDSYLTDWVTKTLGSNLSIPIVTHNLQVTLQNQAGAAIISWTFNNTYPVRWEIAALNSQDNKVLIETLELAYNSFSRLNGG
jgi:phage tail-like protein